METTLTPLLVEIGATRGDGRSPPVRPGVRLRGDSPDRDPRRRSDRDRPRAESDRDRGRRVRRKRPLGLWARGLHRRLTEWWRARRGTNESEGGGRYARARRLWDRYGLPGLSLGGPVLTGVHVAALVALFAGSRSRAVGMDDRQHRRVDRTSGRRLGFRLRCWGCSDRFGSTEQYAEGATENLTRSVLTSNSTNFYSKSEVSQNREWQLVHERHIPAESSFGRGAIQPCGYDSTGTVRAS